jgi:sugar transferase (PEP-CTERM/EpsH1 system associated)
MARRPLICHVIYRLDYGGLENGLVNLINALPTADWDHKIVCLAGFSADFRERLRGDVEVLECTKAPGQDFGLYWRMWRLLRKLRPDIVHTRNLATLEVQLPAWLAGVPVRIHGEHGHDVNDVDNGRQRYRVLRRLFAPLVTQWVTVSALLQDYLTTQVGIAPARVRRLCNGVDTRRFTPVRDPLRAVLAGAPFSPTGRFIIGTIGRMQAVKDQLTLAHAFIEVLRLRPDWRARVALVMVGDGPLREHAQRLLAEADLADIVWLPGTRSDTPALLNALDLFVLPSLAEGISNTILEAMACAVPVLATRVGGNPELVVEGVTGQLVARADPAALAHLLVSYVEDPARAVAQGVAARARIESDFSLAGMIERYAQLYRESGLAHRR